MPKLQDEMGMYPRDIELIDGPTGTELQRRGYETHLPLWSAGAIDERSDLLIEIHRDYLESGADIITANTFRTNSRVIVRAGLPESDARRLTFKSIELAHRAIAESGRPEVRVAGSVAPVEDCYSPDLVPTDEELAEEHTRHIENLVDAGCDLILVETMNGAREAMIAAHVASRSGLPFYLSFVTDQTGATVLSGESLEAVVRHASVLSPGAILTNCSAPSAIVAATTILRDTHRSIFEDVRIGEDGRQINLPRQKRPWRYGGYANSGIPDSRLGWDFVHTVPIDDFVKSAAKMIEAGATVIGSCCGTSPEYTRALDNLRQSAAFA